MSSNTTKRPFHVNRFIEMTRKAQSHYNRGLVEMMEKNYEESQRELEKCMRLRLFMLGPSNFQVAIVHEAIADLKLRMSSNDDILQIQSSSEEIKQAAAIHYLAALRVAEQEQLNRIQQEQAMRLVMKNEEEEKYSDSEIDDKSTSSIKQILEKAERITENMKRLSVRHKLDRQPKKEITKEEELEFMIKRILIGLRRLDGLPV